MTIIRDILSTEPRYAAVTWDIPRQEPEHPEIVEAHRLIMKDAKLNATKAILGKKLVDSLTEMHYLANTYRPDLWRKHETAMLLRAEEALAEWNKTKGVK